jgi:hypothetical protein
VLPVHEFCEAYDRYYHRTRWVFFPLSIVAAVWPVFVLGEMLWSRDGWLHTTLRPLPDYLILFVALAVTTVLLVPSTLLVLWLFGRLTRRDPRLVCPHCNRGLARSFNRVVATRSCPGCTREILIDVYPVEPAPLSRQEAETQANRWQRTRRWGTCELAMIMFALWCVLAFKDEGAIPDSPVGEVVGMTLVVGASAWMVWWIVRGHRRWRAQQIPCPRCGDSQEPSFVVKYGCCGCCSQPLVADAPAEPVGVAERPPTG